ncbi:methyl-accepting chemotaxis protein [Psychrobium sp. MM17-31]|uniref:methyl-accepting chemotaxis protein n=1 Tax=Psychrobium sp. MM17-31 TaxID=2917758 RepID=UPI001EF5DB49|nr:methyl-accepting chemotaxis protein [Psychrobium sp. MM17-31]MCG7530563.1 methyl-accepting chemotaxis protein [Psychrobium sp. MM17-31]
MNNLRKLTIKQRFSIMVGIVIIGLFFQSGLSLYHQYQSLNNQQREKVQHLVESAHATVAHYYQQSQDGKMSEVDAKAAALSAIEAMRYAGSDYFWVNDFTPTMLMHPIKPSLNGKNVTDIQDSDGVQIFVEMLKIVRSQKQGFLPYKWPKPGADEPVDKISFVQEFAPWQWIIGTGVYIDDIQETFAARRNAMLLNTFMIIVIVMGLSYMIGTSILLPTKAASDLMKNIAQGEGDLTKQLNANANDEISRLSYYFNLFTEKMRQSLKEVAANSEQVMMQADMLSQTSHRSNESIQVQNDNATQIATAMEQMTSNIREISANADQANTAANDATTNTVQGKQVVADAIAQIDSLSGNINNVNDVISRLATETDSIGAVLDVIRGIADQTNLLALNAAIEAARAGEQGRGFAVVADEVRTLASRTSQSTDEIQGMIQRLQAGAQEAVTAVTVSKETSDKTVEQAAQAETSLNEIERLIEVISQMSDYIAEATEQQTQAAEEVNKRISDLSQMTVDAATDTEEIANASHDLKHSSSQMSEIVRLFKLD